MQIFHERRRQRSDSKREALMYQLQACARRAGIEAMVLADEQGRVIARSDRLPIAQEVAVFGPFLAKPKTWFGKVQLDGQSRSLAVSPFRLGTSTAYLCAVGAKRHNVGGAFLQAAAGVRRIMTP